MIGGVKILLIQSESSSHRTSALNYAKSLIDHLNIFYILFTLREVYFVFFKILLLIELYYFKESVLFFSSCMKERSFS